jgi:hypothetical protein
MAMSGMRYMGSLVLAAGLLLAAPSGVLAQLPPEQQACISRVNKAGAKVAAAQGKVNSTCLKNALKGRDPDAQFCLTTDPKHKLAKAAEKTFSEAVRWCSSPPPFGFSDPSTVTQAAISQQLALIADIFGSDLDSAIRVLPPDSAHPATGGPQGACQAAVLKAYDKLVAAKLKTFVSCKRAGMKLETILDGAGLEEECMHDPGTGGSGIPDSKGKIEKARSKLRDTVDKKCILSEVQLDRAFPGECFWALGAQEVADCIDERVECRVCLMLNQMDDLSVDCDEFDDGLLNVSCGGLVGNHKCVFGGAGSSIQILTQPLPLPPFAASGGMDINCGDADKATGKAPCDCELQFLDPINIPSIGFICFTPGDPNDPCDTGEIDCDGGNSLDIDMQSNHNIGPCTGNADCESQCAAHCAGSGATVFNDACEGFCQEGVNADNPCTADSDCPGGSCGGKDGGPHGNICGCDCLTIGGNPSVPGGLQCNMGAVIDVEIAPPCADGDVLIAVGQRCIPLTTETLTSQLHNTNNTPAKDFPVPPFTGSGAALLCEDLATSVTTGLSLVGTVNFFDSTIGDLHTNQTLVCQ